MSSYSVCAEESKMIRELAATVILYHGTIPKNVEGIKNNGLVPPATNGKHNFDESVSGKRKNRIFAATTKETAIHWAVQSSLLNMEPQKKLRSRIAIIKFKIDANRIIRDPLGGMASVQIEGSVPKSNIFQIEAGTVKSFLVETNDRLLSWDMAQLKKIIH